MNEWSTWYICLPCVHQLGIEPKTPENSYVIYSHPNKLHLLPAKHHWFRGGF